MHSIKVIVKKLLGTIHLTITRRDPYVAHPRDVKNFNANTDNPYLVSFPRTGSHWLRMMIELYFERPLLVRSFYLTNNRNYLLLHTHDLNLDVVRSNVIYLYRDPVETIYSQMQFHNDDLNSIERITYWSNLYGDHLIKWLVKEAFTHTKTILRYDKLKTDLTNEFGKLCVHLGTPLDVVKLEQVAKEVSKNNVKEHTHHDEKVVNLSVDYSNLRDNFKSQHSQKVWDIVLNRRESLINFFDK